MRCIHPLGDEISTKMRRTATGRQANRCTNRSRSGRRSTSSHVCLSFGSGGRGRRRQPAGCSTNANIIGLFCVVHGASPPHRGQLLQMDGEDQSMDARVCGARRTLRRLSRCGLRRARRLRRAACRQAMCLLKSELQSHAAPAHTRVARHAHAQRAHSRPRKTVQGMGAWGHGGRRAAGGAQRLQDVA